MQKKETAVLIGLTKAFEKAEETREHLDELEFLALTAGADTKKRFVQNLDIANPKTFIGSGKIKEVKTFVDEHKVDMAIFDDELSPSQLKNLEKILECKILDRTNLILDIFAARAQTAQAKTQVELAQCEYLLPRLTRMWTHLSRQKGGIGMKGPGETEIETDRRIIRNKISILKDKLKKIDKQNQTQRKNRGQKVRVALVGYTNAGKSTLMNILSKADIFAENKLFATLDTTVRKVVLDGIPFLLSDTVGFIRKLPHGLVESFKSTLDEVREADVLVHVVDISHPNFEDHLKVVNETLQDMAVNDKPVILVFNKIDCLDGSFFEKLIETKDETPDTEGDSDFDELSDNAKLLTEHLEASYLKPLSETTVFISAYKKYNLDILRKELLRIVIATYKKVYPYQPISVYHSKES